MPTVASGLSTLEGCMIAEELAYGCAGCRHLASCAITWDALPLVIGGSEEQKHRSTSGRLVEEPRVLRQLRLQRAGSRLGCGGHEVEAHASRRTATSWRLSGQKRWITNAGHASFYTGFATIDPGSSSHKGITAFRGAPIASPRWRERRASKENKLGQRASETSDVIFEDVEIFEASEIIGEPGQAASTVAMETFDKSRPMIAAAVPPGIIRRCRRRVEASTPWSARPSASPSRNTRPSSS